MGEIEKSTWNLSYSPASMQRKGRDPCRIGWPGPGCPEVFEGGILESDRSRIFRSAQKTLANEDKCRFSFQKCSLGSIDARSLGRCAVVGLSDTLGYQGAAIDTHDSVFRIGFLPLERYKLRAGTKTTFTVCRGYQKQVKNCLLPVPIDVYGRSPTQKLYPFGDYGQMIVLSTLRDLEGVSIPKGTNALVTTKTKLQFRDLSKGFRRSTGFALVYYIISSGICETLSLYGFSRMRNHSHFFSDIEGGFRSVAPIDAIHSPRFESQLLEMFGVKIF